MGWKCLECGSLNIDRDSYCSFCWNVYGLKTWKGQKPKQKYTPPPQRPTPQSTKPEPPFQQPKGMTQQQIKEARERLGIDVDSTGVKDRPQPKETFWQKVKSIFRG